MSVSELVPKVKNPVVLAPVWNSPILVSASPALSSYQAQSTSPLGARAATATSVIRAPGAASAVTAGGAVLRVIGATAGVPSRSTHRVPVQRRENEVKRGSPATRT